MFAKRYGIEHNREAVAEVVNRLKRKLNATVQMLVARRQLAPVPASTCQDGVCLVNWKPQRPAA